MLQHHLTPIIQAKAITKKISVAHTDITILENLDFSILQGETTAIVGVSGSGKTTLLNILAGLDIPTSGEIILDNINISTFTENKRAEIRSTYIGFVFQTFMLLPEFTALENIMLPLELKNIRHAKEIAMDLIEKVNLTNRKDNLPKTLSGGEQQRIAIARAFANNPKILFADEPTGNLDQKTANSIIDLLFELNAKNNTTLIIVTHDTKLSVRCSSSYLLDNGKLSKHEFN